LFMQQFTLNKNQRFNWLAWILLPLLLLGIIVVGSFSLLVTHAAPSSNFQLSGSYALRATTTAGPQSGLYITGTLGLSASHYSITGTAGGLSYAPSTDYAKITGSTSDDVHVVLTLKAIPHVKIAAIQLVGTYQVNNGHKGSFTGYTGTFSFGTGPNLSSGTWEGIAETTPSASGTWSAYLLVQKGQDKGTSYHAVLTLTQGSGTKVTGTYCPSHGSCSSVTGTNTSGFVVLDLGSPAIFVIRGMFTTPSPGNNGRMNGSFYMPGKGSGKQNDRGYWVANS
jgi:hypothetical protein